MQDGWSVYEVALGTGAIYLAHVFLLAPAAVAAVRRSSAKLIGFWAALSVAIDASRLVFLMLMISAFLTWSLVASAGIVGGDTVAGVEASIARLRGVRNAIMMVEGWGSVILLAVGFSALLFWIVRHHRRRAADVAGEIRNAQFEALLEKFTNGELPDLPPTPDMEMLIAIHERLTAQKSNIEAQLAENPKKAESAGLEDDLRGITEHQKKIFHALVVEDLSRRIEIKPSDALEGDMPRSPRTWRERIGRALISRGLLGRLSWGQRGLLLLNLLLSIPTVLSATQVDIAQRLQASEFKLAELRVDLTARDETRKLASAVAALEAAAEEKEEQTDDASSAQIGHAARTIGQIYERGVADAFAKIIRPDPSPPSAPQVLEQRAEMRGQKARRDILAVVASRKPDSGIYLDPDPVPLPHSRVPDRGPLPGGLGGLSDDALETASVLARNDRGPVTAAGREVARRVEEIASKSPSLRVELVRISRSFQEVARPLQVAHVLMGEIFSGAVSVAPSDVLVPELRIWVQQTGNAAAATRTNSALSESFLATLLQTRDVGKATARVGEVAAATLAQGEFSALRPGLSATLPTDFQFAEMSRQSHPGLRLDNERPAAAQKELVKAVLLKDANEAALSARLSARVEALVAEAGALQTFDDIVPPNSGGGGGVGGGGGGGGGVGGASGKASPAGRATNAAVVRSRDFMRLRGFARVGGVLIGREPEQSVPLDIRSLDWSRNGDRLTLQLTAADGSTIMAGPFNASSIHGALGYAADGRALTVTMISSEPLQELKILLHPALLDTPLGCQTVSIDRFADEATGEDADRLSAQQVVQADVWLYTVARGAALSALRSQLEEEDQQILLTWIAASQRLQAELGALEKADSISMRSALAQALASSPAGIPIRRSLLSRKDHFDESLVEIVKTCRGPNRKIADFAQCATDQATQTYEREAKRLSEAKFRGATAPVAEFQMWSGVREAPFSVDHILSFLRMPTEKILQYNVQVAFTSLPLESYRKGRVADGVDQTEPWEFEDLKISEKVSEFVASRPAKRDVVSSVTEFITLQRLFRLGLSGKLGLEFPVERLAILAQETSADVTKRPTPRWNSKDFEFGFLTAVASAMDQMPDTITAKARACLRANGVSALEGTGAANRDSISEAWRSRTPIGKDDWAASCVFSAPDDESTLEPGVAQIIAFSQKFPTMRELRRALGVDAADRARKIEACGSP